MNPTFNLTSSSRKRLLICSPGVPHKAQGASTVLFYHYINYLKEMNYDILNVLILDPSNYSEKSLAEYRNHMESGGRFEIIPFKKDHFLKIHRYHKWRFDGLPEDLLRKINDFKPDLMLCFDILSAGIITRHCQCPKVVWLGDLNYKTILYHSYYAFKESYENIIYIPFSWLLCQFWKSSYTEILSHFDSVIVSSKSSESALMKLGVRSIYLPYPWPVKRDEKINNGHYPTKTPSFLFFGNLVGLGSRSALHFLFKKIYPRVIKLWGKGGVQIIICGSHDLPQWAKELISKTEEIKCLGYVEDINSLMLSCHAVIIPIDVPIGNRSRIVTAIASGALVIAHQNTALGNPNLVNGVTCFLAKDADKFVEYMRIAYENADVKKNITEKAIQTYEETFKPNTATHMLANELLRVLEK